MYLEKTPQDVIIHLSWSEKLWACRGNVRIPRTQIARVQTERPGTSWRDLRCPGAFVPGVIRSGTYYTPRGKEFWYWTRGKQFLTLELTGGKYKRVVLGVDNPAEEQRTLG